MRLAYVCSDPGIPVFGSKGASIHAQAVLTVLHAHGHEIHLLTPRPGGDPHVELQMHILPVVARGATDHREWSAQQSDAAVADVLARVQPDLVYERYSLWGATATRWAQDHNVPSVLEVNAPLVEEQAAYRKLVDRAAAEKVARDALSRASSVICVSDGVADWARSVSARPDRVRTLANGVDTDRVRPSERPITAPTGSDFTVGFLGTLKPWHGLETLVAAIGQLSRTQPGTGPDRSWRLLVVGDGPLGSSIAELAEAHGVADQVELTGAVASQDVCTQLQRMDVACADYRAQVRAQLDGTEVNLEEPGLDPRLGQQVLGQLDHVLGAIRDRRGEPALHLGQWAGGLLDEQVRRSLDQGQRGPDLVAEHGHLVGPAQGQVLQTCDLPLGRDVRAAQPHEPPGEDGRDGQGGADHEQVEGQVH